jgi:hypothetical protein
MAPMCGVQTANIPLEFPSFDLPTFSRGTSAPWCDVRDQPALLGPRPATARPRVEIPRPSGVRQS